MQSRPLEPSPAPVGAPATRVRWTICALVFFAMAINYLDRQTFSNLIPFFEDDLRLGPIDLAILAVSFTLPYGFAMIFVGRFIDRVGLKRGLATSYLLWNLAMLGHALVHSIGSFVAVRFALGVGESGMYPSSVKTATEWFPIKERSLAMGFFNAAANCGALLAPIVGVAIAVRFSWRYCFVGTGLLGMTWLFFWRRFYFSPENHPRISRSELEYIQADDGQLTEPIGYAQVFGMRPVYGLTIAKAMTDAPFWIYLTWMPKFLVDQFHLKPTFMAAAVAGIYVVADLGSVAGGWLSSLLIQRGFRVGPARKLAMLACALLTVPAICIGFLVDHPPILGLAASSWAIGIMAIAVGAHQGFSCNLFTLISDTVPKSGVALATGVINGFAMIGVSAMQFFVGSVVQKTSSYVWPFILAGTLYPAALLVLHVIVPHVRQFPTTRKANLPTVFVGGLALLGGLLFLQFELNKPPYGSVASYLQVRRAQLHALADGVAGPAAHVGWMSANWYRWQLPDGRSKFELVKLDSRGTPYVEEKGVKATKYKGPSQAEVQRDFP